MHSMWRLFLPPRQGSMTIRTMAEAPSRLAGREHKGQGVAEAERLILLAGPVDFRAPSA